MSILEFHTSFFPYRTLALATIASDLAYARKVALKNNATVKVYREHLAVAPNGSFLLLGPRRYDCLGTPTHIYSQLTN